MHAKRLLRLAGIGRPIPKTRAGRMCRWGERSLTLAALLYVLTIFFPQPLFAYSIETGGVTLYSRSPISIGASRTLDRAVENLRGSALYEDGAEFRVFVCNSPGLYAFFSPVNRDSFAITTPLSGNIFVASADVSKDQSFRYSKANAERSFTSVTAHEMTHVMLRKRAGIVANYRMPQWIKEGYCEYVAGQSTLSDDEGTAMLLQGRLGDTGAERYFLWRKMVEYLLEVRGLSVEELLTFSGDQDAVREEMLAWLKGVQRDSTEGGEAGKDTVLPGRGQGGAGNGY